MSAPVALPAFNAADRAYHAADFRFFGRRPERRHRIRLAAAEEVAIARDVAGITAPIPAGVRAFVGVKLIRPGICRLVLGFAEDGADTDLGEWAARTAFEHFADHDDATLRRLAAKGGRAA